MISVTILTRNSEKYLEKVLQSTRSFNEVLVYDSGSTDRTLDIASKFINVTVVEGTFEGFGKTHNAASAAAKHDWILSIDSDEVVTLELLEEIHQLSLDAGTVYSVRRNNYYNGKWIRWCGWYPDRVFRLYHKRQTQFTNAQVHEAVVVDGMQHHALEKPLNHYPYDTISDFIAKMQHYSSLFAEQNRGKKGSSMSKAVFRGMFTFFKSYILQRGFMGGAEGWIISSYNAMTTYYKYLKLRELNKRD